MQIQQMLTGPQKTHTSDQRETRSLEPLTETDEDETMMENHGDDDVEKPVQSEQTKNH